MLVICLDNGIISESSTLAVRPADRRLSVCPATVARFALARCGLATTFYSGSALIRSLQIVMSRLPEEQRGSVEAGVTSITMRAFVQYFGLSVIIFLFCDADLIFYCAKYFKTNINRDPDKAG